MFAARNRLSDMNITMDLPLLTIDLAHPPRPPATVEQELLDAWIDVRNSPTIRALKVIHGYGSGGKGSRTKDVVRNWIFRNRSKFMAVIEGEEYGLYDQKTQELRKALGNFPDADLDAANPGVTVVWIK